MQVTVKRKKEKMKIEKKKNLTIRILECLHKKKQNLIAIHDLKKLINLH